MHFKYKKNSDDRKSYRLRNINYFKNIYENKVHSYDSPFESFYLPLGMNEEDAFKVLSYFKDIIDSNSDNEVDNVISLDSIIDIERFGFKRTNNYHDNNCVDLFVVTGIVQQFLKSKYFDKFVKWYVPDVTKEDVMEIYSSLGIDFKDVFFDDFLLLDKEGLVRKRD